MLRTQYISEVYDFSFCWILLKKIQENNNADFNNCQEPALCSIKKSGDGKQNKKNKIQLHSGLEKPQDLFVHNVTPNTMM
jgi:hypothetical protein